MVCVHMRIEYYRMVSIKYDLCIDRISMGLSPRWHKLSSSLLQETQRVVQAGSAGLMHRRPHPAHSCATKRPDLECKDLPRYVISSSHFIYVHVTFYWYLPCWNSHVLSSEDLVDRSSTHNISGQHDWLTFQSCKYSTRGVLNKRDVWSSSGYWWYIWYHLISYDHVWRIIESSG